jgi:hypothetical protein
VNPENSYINYICLFATSICIAIVSMSLLRHFAYDWCIENRFMCVAIVASVSVLPPLIDVFRKQKNP